MLGKILQKKIACLTILCILCGLLSANVSAGEATIQTSIGEVLKETEETVAAAPGMKAKAAVLIDAETGQILFENNKDERLQIASVTKIMTLLLIMEAIESGMFSYDTKFACSQHANSMGGSQIWLQVGEEMTVSELLKAICVNSANDASVVMAEAIGGSEEGFVNLMNEKAKELGMNNTLFSNASGLDLSEQYSSAYDVALMSRELVKHEEILKYTTIWMDSLRGGETSLVNTNKLIRFYKGATGLKTGYTNAAGYCLSASARRGDMSLIAVTLGSASSDDRFESITGLLNYGFANFVFITPEIDKNQLGPIKVISGVSEKVFVEYPKISGFVVPRGSESKIEQKIELADDVRAPVEKGQTLGKITFTSEGTELVSVPLKAANSVSKMTFWHAFYSMILRMLFMK